MICDPDEFLLLMQKWATDSARVVLTLIVFDEPERSALTIRLRGRLAVPGEEHKLLRFDLEEEGFLIIDVAQWPQIGYADKNALSEFWTIEESFILDRPGASLSLSRMSS